MEEIKVSPGTPTPLGFSIIKGQANFALFSKHASKVTLGLFKENSKTPLYAIPMQRTNDTWHVAVENLPYPLLYGFQLDGPFNPGKGELFRSDLWMADPYAKILDTPIEWGAKEKQYLSYAIETPAFDWQEVSSPRIDPKDLIIYEMHVRGFTEHPSSQVKAPGTFLGIIEKIPYLKQLGVNAIELLPIFEFDEIHSKDIQPHTGEPLPNYWGYNTLFFFAPMRRYCSHPSIFSAILEFKTLVRELHRNGIEVILDVVYNHTGEGKEKEYFVNFRGIDNLTYYIVDPLGYYRDFTGCGNTFNCNHPNVQEFILNSLKYWVEEMQVDGFRFDLASIFTRDIYGNPMHPPPVVEKISHLFPKEKKIKLIAEAWDAGGLYQVGYFPNSFPNWSDWNGKYRDNIRRFIKGTPHQAGAFADSLVGSGSVYGASKTPVSSINFITAHDGYTIRDLVTYQMKHNYDNGEMNQDGNNSNDNWNCGAEGPTLNPSIAELREKQMRNFLLALFVSQGIPMILMGDEYGHSRKGNNNPFTQDNEINWFLWNILEKNQKIFSFVSSLIQFRKKHSILRQTRFLTDQDVEWHGTKPNQPNWSDQTQLIAYTLKGSPSFYIAFNAHNFANKIELPSKTQWIPVIYTEKDWDAQNFHLTSLEPIQEIELTPYSAILAISNELK